MTIGQMHMTLVFEHERLGRIIDKFKEQGNADDIVGRLCEAQRLIGDGIELIVMSKRRKNEEG